MLFNRHRDRFTAFYFRTGSRSRVSAIGWVQRPYEIGDDLFFVLSGFLITVLLVQEHHRTATIKLKDFYIRRGVRLLPALFLLISFCLVFALISQSKESALVTLKGAVYTLFYVANWAQIPPNPPGIGALSHAWSLSVEEQFYILWPLMLLALLKLERRWVVFSILGNGHYCGPARMRDVEAKPIFLTADEWLSESASA